MAVMEEKTEDSKRDYALKSVENTMKILDYFGSSYAGELTIKQIQEALGISKPTVFRNLQVLTKHGYLEKIENSSKYRLGLKIIELASYKIDMLEIRVESLPVLMFLQGRTSTSISLCELNRTEVDKLFMIRGNLVIQRGSHSVQRIPAYCSSPGKVLLSALSSNELDVIYKDYTFTKFTDTTITSLEDLKKELKKIREQGYAINNGEQESYTKSIAVPIYGYSGVMIAAISAGGSQESMTDSKIAECLIELRNAAKIISRKMGYVE